MYYFIIKIFIFTTKRRAYSSDSPTVSVIQAHRHVSLYDLKSKPQVHENVLIIPGRMLTVGKVCLYEIVQVQCANLKVSIFGSVSSNKFNVSI